MSDEIDNASTATPADAPQSPARRKALLSAGAGAAAAASTLSVGATLPGAAKAAPVDEALLSKGADGKPLRQVLPPRGKGKSPWGLQTASEPAARPLSVRPGEETLPTEPRPYTDIKSYHAHIYFDEDNYEKAALLRRWVVERFPVELGNWNLKPRGPHVTPSFYFGFTNDLLPLLVPWLQLNSLGLTILLHPNTGDGKSDHLYYTLWVNRSQPVNAYNWRVYTKEEPEPPENIFPNIVPTVPLET